MMTALEYALSVTPRAAEADALLSRMTSPPDAPRKAAIRALVAALKTAGVWNKLDCLYVMAAHAEQAAGLNWIADRNTLVAVASPTFTPDRGYAGDGVAAYLSTGFNPATAPNPKFTRDDASMYAWHLTDLLNGGAASFDLGEPHARFVRSISGGNPSVDIRAVMNAGVNIVAPYAVGKGWSRTGASAWRYYSDGALLGADPRTNASADLFGGTFSVLKNGDAPNFGVNRCAIFCFGAGLSTPEMLALHTASRAYLEAVGAIA